METINTTQQPKRPTGMTILLVLSFLNACFNIFSNIVMYFFTPMMADMVKNGQLEEMMEPFMTAASEEMRIAMMDSMTALSNIKPAYYLMMSVLFVGSLIGVLRMFKLDKRGIHFYAISQLLMLIVSSLYKYPIMHPSPFTTDLMLTTMFIVVYYLYFKRLEMQKQQNPSNPFQE
ncbi:MAG: hypothetical protein IJ057_12190 [Bacteroidales bacterium]|nr:hypothetical protein [Bacteroidales bacterium]